MQPYIRSHSIEARGFFHLIKHKTFSLLLRQFFQITRVAAEEALKPSGYSFAQCGVLLALNKEPGLTSAEMARRFMITPQAMGELLKSMEKLGLLRREQHSDNARMQALGFTQKGRRALRNCLRSMRIVEANMQSLMGPADKSDFIRLLSLAIDGLDPRTEANPNPSCKRAR